MVLIPFIKNCQNRVYKLSSNLKWQILSYECSETIRTTNTKFGGKVLKYHLKFMLNLKD